MLSKCAWISIVYIHKAFRTINDEEKTFIKINSFFALKKLALFWRRCPKVHQLENESKYPPSRKKEKVYVKFSKEPGAPKKHKSEDIEKSRGHIQKR